MKENNSIAFVRLPETLLTAIKAAARAEGRTTSGQVRWYVMQGLASRAPSLDNSRVDQSR
jgi:hypothetical protein